jgi:hypothetical protein
MALFTSLDLVASLARDAITVAVKIVRVLKVGVRKRTCYIAGPIATSSGAINIAVNRHARARVAEVTFGCHLRVCRQAPSLGSAWID